MNQITSEQIIKDSLNDRVHLEDTEQSIQDLEELKSLQLKKRKDFEQHLNQNRLNFGQWIRYAKWEIEFNRDFKRARSIFERALEVNIEHVPFWTHYIKFELSNNNYNHARNLLDRAVATLPHVEKFWYLYVQTEEFLQNYAKVRSLFESWLTWHPPVNVWDDYTSFEKRYDEFENARSIFKRYVVAFPETKSWVKWINFETRTIPKPQQNLQVIRNVFELAVDGFVAKKQYTGLAEIINRWAAWELSQQESERAVDIFKLALDKTKFSFPDSEYSQILSYMTEFEKNMDLSTDGTNLSFKRKLKYIRNVEQNPNDFDSWWLLVEILVDEGNEAEIRAYFERAVASVPPDETKSLLWRRYIFLWIKYALWEELTNNNVDGARDLWNRCLKIIPHKKFTFSKIWIMAAEFEIRNGGENGLSTARKLLGRGIGSVATPKNKIFKYYISLEKRLGEWDRVRRVYEKWFDLGLTKSNLNGLQILLEFIDFEKKLNESSRCESLYEMGLSLVRVPAIKNKLTPYDLLWSSFVDFYTEEFEYDKARKLYRGLLDDEPNNVKAWIALALFESSIPTEQQLMEFNQSDTAEFEFELQDEQRQNTRSVFAEANAHFKKSRATEERAAVLEAWKEYEEANGDESSLQQITDKLPTVVKKITDKNGVHQETLEYVFPEDKPAPALNRFLANAQKWIESQ